MKITILTLFPEFFDSFQNTSIIKRSIDQKLVDLKIVNFREYSTEKHHSVDDTPCGGGAGMLLSCQPIVDCLKAIAKPNSTIIMLTPQGDTFHQNMAKAWTQNFDDIILLCGHYEGFDERVREYVDLQISIGDFVLTGGEGAALIISDALIRLLEGVILPLSHQEESFEEGLLEYPQYTRPIEYDGLKVPEVLLSGHHAKIVHWKQKEAIKKTLKYRPDLLKSHKWNAEDKKILKELQEEDKEIGAHILSLDIEE